MADGFSFVMRGIPEVQREFARIDKSVDRASMWAVRQAGRRVKQVSRARAPVYRGTRTDIPKGRLKKSISSDRRLSGGNGAYGVRVGPRGWPVKGYAGKQEARSPYMQAGFETAAMELRQIAEQAWTRASRR